MAFRIFRLLTGVILVGLGLWFIAGWPGKAHGLTALVGMIQSGVTTTAVEEVMQVVMGLGLVGVYYWALWSASAIHRHIENIFNIPELLRKIGFTIFLLCIYRIGFHIPLPGLNQDELGKIGGGSGAGKDAMDYYDMFTGGNLAQCTLFGLGIMPYISASIIFQLLTTVVPSLEKIMKEGPAGQKKIQEYTRYATVLLCVIQAGMWMKFILGSSNYIYPHLNPTLVFLMGILGLTAGTMFMMWLGEQIDEYGIGNGISLLIMGGIVARVPRAIRQLGSGMDMALLPDPSSGRMGVIHIVILVAAFVFVVAGAILITQAQRRIPIHQAKHVRGRRMTAGGKHYMPLRVNHGGVMPIIFASSLMIFPGLIFQQLQSKFGGSFWVSLSEAFRNGHYIYTVLYVGMIYFFAYFWTTVQFKPKDTSEQLRDHGSFIPGLRPGKRTADYLERVMERITYCGAAFLSVVAVLPMVVASAMSIPFSISAFLGGTGLLIVVSVALDLVQRIESNLVMRDYGGFLGGSARIKGSYS
ncbi:MAG: preprotein translocase subunit SecY [Planctomycetota bacterium]|nr:preprotein translocase subunit SecY [Planctomycetota bacterium]